MTPSEILQNVISAAKRDLDASKSMLEAKHYTWSLFMWHLVIEKMLKAVLIKQNKQMIYTHNLIALYKNVDIDLGPNTIDSLAEINKFNIEARYDFEKEEFYKKATKDYTDHWTRICELLFEKLSTYVSN